MIVREATDEDVLRVCRNMREQNAREIFAMRAHEDREAFAGELLAAQDQAIKTYALCGYAGEAIALVAAYQVGPRAAAVFMLATDDWSSIAWPAVRFMRETFIPRVLVPNVNVAECDVLDDPTVSRVWLERLGFLQRGFPVPAGKDGEPFVRMAWVNPSIDDAAQAVASQAAG